MKIGIMQPYFFPYIGYFQLINMVDKYVVFDDGPYAKNKWACRNQILINRAPGYFRVKIMKASHDHTFNEIRISNDIDDDSWDIRTAFLNYPDKVLVTPGQDS